MNLDFSEEQKALKAELAGFLEKSKPLRGARDALEGRVSFDVTLWRELGRLGWLSVAVPEEYGGQGLGYEMLCCVSEELGRCLAAVPFANSIVLAAEAVLLFGSPEQKRRYLPGLASGEKMGAFAIAEASGPLHPAAITATVAKGRLNGVKVAVDGGVDADLLVVVANQDGIPGLFIADPREAGVMRTARVGVDRAHSPAAIDFVDVTVEPLGIQGWNHIQRLLDRAAIPFAFEQVGVADAALELATRYVKERKAFGRRIGSFQAIKHKLADVWIANELARSNAYYSAWALETDAPALPLAAATARVSASEALERAARELIQVHGGIAVTWEHDAHLFYRRAQYLALALGGLREWQNRLVGLLAMAA